MRTSRRVGRCALLVALATNVWAEEKPADKNAPPAVVSYFKDIRPIFQDQCQGCHQPAKRGGDYGMTTYAELLKAGESEMPGIVPGKPDDSSLFQNIVPTDGKAEMPKGKPPLAEAQIALVRRWIEQGAKDDSPATTGPVVDQAHPPEYQSPPVITSVASSRDGKWLAVSGYHEVLLYRADSCELAGRLVGLSERIEAVAFSPDSSRLAVAGGQPARMGEVQVWNPADKKLLLSVPVTYDTVYGVSWSPDGTKIAFGCADNTVRAINAKSGNQVLFQGAHNDWVLDTVFSKDSSHLLSVSRDRTLKLIEVATQRFIDNVTSITPGALKGGLNAVDGHPTKDEVLVGGADGVPKIYKIYRTEARKIGDDANLIKAYESVPGRIFAVQYNADGSQFVVGSSSGDQGEVRVYRVGEAKPLAKYVRQSGPIYSATFSADGQQLFAGGFDGQIVVLNAKDAAVLKEFTAVPPKK